MRYLSEDEAMRMQGLGYVGEVFEGVDGGLYEWVDGVDAWGGSIGFWHGLSEPEAPPLSGLGALYEAPDGTLYQVHGLAEEEAAADPPATAGPPAASATEDPSGDDKGAPAMGPGRPGEIRVGPDSKKYRWVRGRDAQGKTTGFWRRLRPVAAGPARPPQRRPGIRLMPRPGGARPAGRKPLLRRLLPFAKVASAFIPGVGPAVAAGLTVAGKVLKKRKGVAGVDGLGALYEAPDGSLFHVQGIADDELHGFVYGGELDGISDDELQGFAADDDLDGFGAGDELDGFAQNEDLHGFSENEIQGFGAGYEPLGLEQGYVRQDNVNGLEAYIPEKPAQTRWLDSSSEPPEIWKPLW